MDSPGWKSVLTTSRLPPGSSYSPTALIIPDLRDEKNEILLRMASTMEIPVQEAVDPLK
jgi:hypothetical protein